MVESCRLRRVFIPLSYAVLVTVSPLGFGRLPLLSPLYSWALTLTGLALFAASLLAAVRVHRVFPERHDRPGDFPQLITWGPYARCRHPFYLALIVNQLSIPLMLHSLVGMLVFTLLLPGWHTLIEVEERELIEYWGDRYVVYMRCVPRLIPRPWRRGRCAPL